jgi:PadR family transcriptional regulator PadR
MNIENTQSQMRKGILEFCILSIIRRGEAYPSDIVEEMKAANLQILEGTLYPLLTRLKNADMLTYRWVESNSGPPRKYFSLTEKGEVFYGELEQTWNELSNGVNALTSKKQDEPLNSHQLVRRYIVQTDLLQPNTRRMKKIININLSGRVIPIEDIAYEKLQQYIESLRRYFANEEGRDEIINDIEGRIAELMSDKVRKGAESITDSDVEEIISSMGRVEDFEAADQEAAASHQPRPVQQQVPTRVQQPVTRALQLHLPAGKKEDSIVIPMINLLVGCAVVLPPI